MNERMNKLQESITRLVPSVVDWFKDFHQHPELSMQEFRTADIVARHLQNLGYEVHEKIGVTGVVAILKNGEGKTVMLRADMDALPMEEKTGLPFSSTATGETLDGVKTPIAHMCGHDLHVAWMMAVAEILMQHRDIWSGTLMLVFQPGEEVGKGALAMVEDMQDRFPKPDVILGQHVMVGKAGTVGIRNGAILTAGDSLHVKFHGKGGHGSMPQNTVDPVMIAAYSAVRLQSIVSRETSPLDSAVLTIGSIQAGTKENVIPDEAILKLNMRSFKPAVREKMLKSVKNICSCECHASGARDPDISFIDSYPVTNNDTETTAILKKTLRRTLPIGLMKPHRRRRVRISASLAGSGAYLTHSGLLAPPIMIYGIRPLQQIPSVIFRLTTQPDLPSNWIRLRVPVLKLCWLRLFHGCNHFFGVDMSHCRDSGLCIIYFTILIYSAPLFLRSAVRRLV